jgi:hypothetical protein
MTHLSTEANSRRISVHSLFGIGTSSGPQKYWSSSITGSPTERPRWRAAVDLPAEPRPRTTT